MLNRLFVAVLAVLAGTLVAAQAPGPNPRFTDAYPATEFAARRAQVMAAVGDGVAIIAGATEQPNYEKFKQNKQFFYLSGVEVPRAILLIDGRAKSSTLFLPARNAGMERSEGPILVPGDEARKITGIESVVDRATFDAVLKTIADERRNIHMPFRRESIGAVAVDRVTAHDRATSADPWDGRPSKEAVFREKVQQIARGSEVIDLDRTLDNMRVVKSPAEIAMVREATRISSLAIAEGLRAAEVGMHEYEIEAVADFVFKRHNAMGIGYYALVATGANAAWPHYHAAQSKLADGDLVLFDYAPEFKYYTSDVTRMFPANGRFASRQREMYGIYLKLYQALMSVIGPGPADARLKDAHAKMTTILAGTTFTDPKIKEAAERFVTGFAKGGRSFGHGVGLEVHDVMGQFDGVYKPGMILTIEPALTIPDERIYVRLEDVILITPTGYENLSANLPMDIDGIERLMREPSIFRK